ncbi:BN159_2729 family protein [Streptomyces sp. NPDC001073]|uniref:BN159_2729 family protein n=1 Tax=Streptomyces sp. NPDC001642 TaxID=3154392 RepID=UPI0033270E26
MNGNVLHAARVIRTVLATVRSEQAAAVAHALDSASLLVDPERSFGVVLYRTPDGSWSRTARPVTELERQAMTWDASCERARHVARSIARQLDAHPGPHSVRAEGDRVRVLLRVDGPAQWARWRAYFGIAIVGERSEPHTLMGEGEREGVRVTVVALSAPTASPESTTGAAPRLFRIGETLYDLALPMRDGQGGIWYFEGRRRGDGMPLMALDGRPERCSLVNVAAYLGPMSPVLPDDGTDTAPTAAASPPTPPAPLDMTHPRPLLSVAVPPSPPDVRERWTVTETPETVTRPEEPRPPVTSNPPDPRTLRELPELPEPQGLWLVSHLPEQMPEQMTEMEREQGQAQSPGPGSPAEPEERVVPPHRPAWAEPFGPLVPSVPAAGPAGRVR